MSLYNRDIGGVSVYVCGLVDPEKFFIIPSLAYGDFPQVRKDKARCDHYQYNSKDLDVIVIFLITFNRVKSYFLIDKLVNMEWVLVLMKNKFKGGHGKGQVQS